MRIETLGCAARAPAMWASFMVATEPDAARRTWCLLSLAKADALKGEGDGEGEGLVISQVGRGVRGNRREMFFVHVQ